MLPLPFVPSFCCRLLLAMALAHDPDILFLDEPTTGLDPNMRRTFWQLLNQVKQLGKAIVLTLYGRSGKLM
ncbi:MAG: ABC-2 type transport system ATP-binding protein [Cognaticolwellia sp.]|jgi:ABC-2 type transport system ATP-binding protein